MIRFRNHQSLAEGMRIDTAQSTAISVCQASCRGGICIRHGRIDSCEPTAHRFVFSDSASLRFCRLGPTAHHFDWWQRQLLFATLGRSFAPVPPLPASVPVTTRETSQIGGRTRDSAARPPASGATRPRRSRPAVQAGTATSRRRRCRLRPTFKGVMRCRMESPSDEAMRCRFADSHLPRLPDPSYGVRE